MITHPEMPIGKADPPVSIERMIEEYGAWRVLRAALAALAMRRRRLALGDASPLNNHLRRDIGLPPAYRPQGFWDMR